LAEILNVHPLLQFSLPYFRRIRPNRAPHQSFSVRFVALVQQRSALPARHGGAVFCGDAFHFGPMSSFLVARIAQHHTLSIEGVPVPFLSFVPGHRSHP
jgi:hypothetical protein